MPHYEISGLVMNIESDCPKYLERLADYVLKDPRECDLSITLNSEDYIEVPEGSMILDENIKWLKKPAGQSGYYLYTPEKRFGKILVLADIDDDWRTGRISYLNLENVCSEEERESILQLYIHIISGLMGVMFRHSLLQLDGIVIHSSALMWEGKGIMFSAPAGIGKSTQVKLWQEYIEEVIVLNDDTPALRVIDNIPFIYGTPWSGSSFIQTNACAPLVAIVMLEQAKENSLSKLSKEETIMRLMPRILLPYFDQTMMSKTIEIFEKIISSVPVYLLKGRPDKEAVNMVYQLMR